jgi:hypothetical protein
MYGYRPTKATHSEPADPSAIRNNKEQEDDLMYGYRK